MFLILFGEQGQEMTVGIEVPCIHVCAKGLLVGKEVPCRLEPKFIPGPKFRQVGPALRPVLWLTVFVCFTFDI